MSRVSIDILVQKTLDGIRQAETDYHKWSNEKNLFDAPEYFITTWIARKIRGLRNYELWVTMEHGIKDTVQQANALRRGRPRARLQLNGRYDIVIWRKNNTPRCVVEVKHRVTGYTEKVQSDVSRICEALSKEKNKLQCGILAFYTWTWTREYKSRSNIRAIHVLEERVTSILKDIKEDPATKGRRIEPTMLRKV